MGLKLTLLLAAAAALHAAEPAEGRWEGAVHIPGRELTVVIDLAQDANGKWIGSAILPGFGVKGAPLADLDIKGSDVQFAVKAVLSGAVFRGRLNGNRSLSGEFQQGGNTAPFSLQKVGPAQVDPPRLGTPVSQELEGTWQGEFARNGYTLKATLELTNHPGAPASAKFRVVGKRDNNLPVDRVEQDGEFLTVSVTEYQIAFEGQFRGGEIAGTFRQGPEEMPLVLRRQ